VPATARDDLADQQSLTFAETTAGPSCLVSSARGRRTARHRRMRYAGTGLPWDADRQRPTHLFNHERAHLHHGNYCPGR
jgi:hypothetical protein